jgi:hypothetical protein
MKVKTNKKYRENTRMQFVLPLHATVVTTQREKTTQPLPNKDNARPVLETGARQRQRLSEQSKSRLLARNGGDGRVDILGGRDAVGACDCANEIGSKKIVNMKRGNLNY